ncbi:unnamed protein product, partial [Ilex paraguariensis]
MSSALRWSDTHQGALGLSGSKMSICHRRPTIDQETLLGLSSTGVEARSHSPDTAINLSKAVNHSSTVINTTNPYWPTLITSSSSRE